MRVRGCDEQNFYELINQMFYRFYPSASFCRSPTFILYIKPQLLRSEQKKIRTIYLFRPALLRLNIRAEGLCQRSRAIVSRVTDACSISNQLLFGPIVCFFNPSCPDDPGPQDYFYRMEREGERERECVSLGVTWPSCTISV